eukprot:4447563-Karenia_brevis.AAC.1
MAEKAKSSRSPRRSAEGRPSFQHVLADVSQSSVPGNDGAALPVASINDNGNGTSSMANGGNNNNGGNLVQDTISRRELQTILENQNQIMMNMMATLMDTQRDMVLGMQKGNDSKVDELQRQTSAIQDAVQHLRPPPGLPAPTPPGGGGGGGHVDPPQNDDGNEDEEMDPDLKLIKDYLENGDDKKKLKKVPAIVMKRIKEAIQEVKKTAGKQQAHASR